MKSEVQKLQEEIDGLKEQSREIDSELMKLIKFEAAANALWLFAVWKDGVQWVNDRTLLEAIELLEKEYGIE